jgi:DNA-binding SARP family transcriptional activator
MEAGSTAVINAPWKIAMGNNLRDASGRFHEPSADFAALWKQSEHYLNTGEYVQLGHVLQKAHQMQMESGILDGAQKLAAARDIWAAHQQAIDEVESLQKAHQEATQRVRSLEQELRLLLKTALAKDSPNPASAHQPLKSKSRFLEWVHRFLGSERGEQSVSIQSPPVQTNRAITSRNQPVTRRFQWVREHPRGVQHRVNKQVTEATGHLVTQAAKQPSGSNGRPVGAYLPANTLRSHLDAEEKHALAVHFLGPLRIFHDGRLVTDWNGLKGLAVLKYLVAQRGKPVSKEVLMDLIWPESDPEAARRNLHQAIYSLRQTLRSNQPDFRPIEFHNDHYQINPMSDLWIDFVAFEKLAQEGKQFVLAGRTAEALQAFTRAETLYQGDFLEGDLYEEWAIAQREQLRLLYLDVTSWLTEHFVKQAEFTAAIALAQKTLAQDACHEQAHRCLMVSYAAQGQRHLAVRQYLACVQALRTELDLSPSAETSALYRQITAVN